MNNTIFADLPDVLDAKTLAQALSISKSSAYALMNLEDFPTLQLGARKLVTKPDLIAWMSRHIRDGGVVNDPPEEIT